MKRINDLAIKSLEDLATDVKLGVYDQLYLPWRVLRKEYRNDPDIKGWKDKILRLIKDMQNVYKEHTEAQRFQTNITSNIQVQVFVMGGYDRKKFETSSEICLTI